MRSPWPYCAVVVRRVSFVSNALRTALLKAEPKLSKGQAKAKAKQKSRQAKESQDSEETYLTDGTDRQNRTDRLD